MTNKSLLKSAYNKERARITKQVNRMQKRGYEFSKNPIPARPKTITQASVNRLKKITTPTLYEKSSYVNSETGEILTGKQGRNVERSESAAKGRVTKIIKDYESRHYDNTQSDYNSTDYEEDYEEQHPESGTSYQAESEQEEYPKFDVTVIRNYIDNLTQFNCKESAKVMIDWTHALINQFGEPAVAIMLEQGAEAGNILTFDILYHDASRMSYQARMLEYLPNIGQYTRDKLTDALNENNYEEDNED